ncbi:MAG: pyridoxal phosphate-dependent aminotransferase [Rhodospirillaceae bacterium]
MTMQFEAQPHPRIKALGTSPIRALSDIGLARKDVLPFWFGESDLPTADFICDAAAAALKAGQTFYAQNLGIPPLRDAIARYTSTLHGVDVGAERIAVTNSGVTGIMLAMQAVLDPGDKVVIVTPVWPNLFEIPRILSADVTYFPLEVRDGAWHLDEDRLLAALTPEVRLVLINSPSNPTGWQITPAQQRRIVEHCRRHGTWILADEVYERMTFDRALKAAPSFLSAAKPEDRLIVVNSFSKSWSMTGWRLGWLVAPAALTPHLGKLIEYNFSSSPQFVQAAGIVAIERGEEAVTAARERLIANRDTLLAGLRRINSIEATTPAGGMYAFFRFEGENDSFATAKRLIEEVGLGLAPGVAFSPAGEGWLRWCFAAEPAKLADGLDRLRRFASR